MWLTEHLHCIKTVPWRQGARLRSTTHRVQCQRVKREAAKKSLRRKKTLCHSSHCRAKTVCYGKTVRRLQRRCTDPIKTRLHLQGGPR